MVPGSRYNTDNLFVRAFPAPTYLTTPAVGIDISDYAIKHIKIGRKHPHFHLESHGRIDLPLGVVERGEIAEPETVSKLLQRIRSEYSYDYVHMALPEERAYLFQMDVPVGTRSEVEQVIEFHLKENVPLGANEAYFDYNVLEQHHNKCRINVSVYPAAIVDQYVAVVEAAGLNLLSIEIEGQATARALLSHTHLEPTLIVDVGRTQASVSMSTNGEVTFTASLETGGDIFTRAIARSLDLSFQEAEKLKRDHGFRDTEESAMVYDAIRPAIVELKEAINKHFMYWQMHATSTGIEEGDVSRVILVGGNANMIGLPEYLEAALEVPVVVGNVWTNIFSFNGYLPDMHHNESLEFATAAGLALRSLLRSST